MRKPLLIALLSISSMSAFGQTELSVGYNFGRNTYIESKQDNLSTKFNLGWDFDPSNAEILLAFEPKGTDFTIKNKMNWNRYTRGIILGLGFNKDDAVNFEFDFTGCTNIESGKRQNVLTGVEEELTLKTKFGGCQALAVFNVHERISLHAGIGVSLFRTRYSWSGEAEYKNKLIGTRSNPLSSGTIKYGDRDLTLTFPVGLTGTILHFEKSEISLKARLSYTFVWNEMVQTDILTLLPYSYNLSSAALGIILSKTF